MQTEMTVYMRAQPEQVFNLAAAVENWPEILPHYRYVKLLSESSGERVVEMAACRGRIPVQWTAVEEILPEQKVIRFRHIGGVTRGMDVAWTLTPFAGGVRVHLLHRFEPGWPLPDALVRLVVGDFFVDSIAAQTLGCFKRLVEGGGA